MFEGPPRGLQPLRASSSLPTEDRSDSHQTVHPRLLLFPGGAGSERRALVSFCRLKSWPLFWWAPFIPLPSHLCLPRAQLSANPMSTAYHLLPVSPTEFRLECTSSPEAGYPFLWTLILPKPRRLFGMGIAFDAHMHNFWNFLFFACTSHEFLHHFCLWNPNTFSSSRH